jgi:mRNA-degrading endonuclease toxin of MazEF toxin-antitoxin module
MNEFDIWNEIKKKVDSGENPPDRFPKEGEVWLSALGKNVGYEQNGSGNNFARPVLIVKKFNNQMFWSIALSTKQKPFDFYHNFTDPNNNEVSAILAQLKLLSVKRLDRKLYDLSEKQLKEIKDKLKKFL